MFVYLYMFASDLEAFLDTTIPNSSLSAFLQAGPLVKVESFLARICMEHLLRYVQHSTESLEREVSKIWMHGREKVSHMNDQVTQAATSLWHNLCKPVVDERVGSTITYRASATLDEI